MIKIAIGFDFGLKRIGVAVGQVVTKTAKPLATVKTIHGEPNWNEIDQIIKTWCPQMLVVGFPIHMDGSEQALTQTVRNFAAELERRFHLPVQQMDERLTTLAAREEIFAQGGYKALRHAEIDSIAAKIILENWLNSLPDEREL